MSLNQTARAETNRANARRSTGPKSAIGKRRSSQNSFQHGLYSKQLILPGEDPEEFDHLRATLRTEHQPANIAEEILDAIAPVVADKFMGAFIRATEPTGC